MSAEIERAIEAHESRKRRKWLNAIFVVAVVLGLCYGALYGCACMMHPAGLCP